MNEEKTNSESAHASAESIIAGGSGAMRTSMEQCTKNYESALTFGKDAAEAMMTSAAVAGKGAESLHSELHAYSKRSMDDAMAATRAIMGSKSFREAFDLQADYARKSFENYIEEMTKVREILSAATKDGYASFEGRARAWMHSGKH